MKHDVLIQQGMKLSVYAVKTVDAVTPVTADEAPAQIKSQGMHTQDALMCLAMQNCIALALVWMLVRRLTC